MIKKALSFLLVLSILLGCSCALAESGMSEKEKIAHLKEIVQSYLDSNGFKYTYNAKLEAFDLSYELKSTLGSCDVTMFIYDDMLAVSATPNLRVPDKNKDKTAIYITLVNDHCFYAQHRMDYEKGLLFCRSAQVIEEVFPSAAEVDTLLIMVLYTIEKYGDGLNKVAQLGYDPHEAFQEINQAETPNSL